MKYMMIFRETDAAFAERTSPEKGPAYRAAWMAYIDALGQSGTVVSGAGLEVPATATTVRVRDGVRHVQDGPYPDSKEQLGGYFVIDVAGLDEALAWAARAPSASYASVEVRPVMPSPM